MKIIILVLAVLSAPAMAFFEMPETDFERVAAMQVSQSMGPVGGSGDILTSIVIIPATTSPGGVYISDGNDVSMSVFAGGATSVADLQPFTVPLRARSVNGAWKVSTGNNVSVIGVGKFK